MECHGPLFIVRFWVLCKTIHKIDPPSLARRFVWRFFLGQFTFLSIRIRPGGVVAVGISRAAEKQPPFPREYLHDITLIAGRELNTSRDQLFFYVFGVFALRDARESHEFTESAELNHHWLAAFTAKIEEELDEVAEGAKEWQPVIRKFYDPFSKHLETKYDEVEKQIADEE